MPWLLATIHPNAERQVMAHLRQRSIDHHVFWERRQYARHGRVIERLIPAFSRYVFVPVDTYGRVASVPHVTGSVRFGDHEAVVSNEILSELFQKCEFVEDVGPVFRPDAVPSRRLKPGDEVVVTDNQHVMFGKRAVYLVAMGPTRARLQVLGAPFSVEVDESILDIYVPRSSRRRSKRRKKFRR